MICYLMRVDQYLELSLVRNLAIDSVHWQAGGGITFIKDLIPCFPSQIHGTILQKLPFTRLPVFLSFGYAYLCQLSFHTSDTDLQHLVKHLVHCTLIVIRNITLILNRVCGYPLDLSPACGDFNPIVQRIVIAEARSRLGYNDLQKEIRDRKRIYKHQENSRKHTAATESFGCSIISLRNHLELPAQETISLFAILLSTLESEQRSTNRNTFRIFGAGSSNDSPRICLGLAL